MKIYAGISVAALFLASETSGFSVKPTVMLPATTSRRSSSLCMTDIWQPVKQADIRIEGGSTLKTFQMPAHAERVQYIITSPTGRPIKAKVELWIGPIRCVHEFIYDCMDGKSFPLRATLQFKKLSPVLKISTHGSYEFPLECGVFVPSPDESEMIGDVTKNMFYTAPMKERVQGGSTIDNKGGAIRTFHIDPAWEKTQIMVWSKDVGKKSFKTNIEILQGPNNAKQHLNLRCGGSTQPYHAVIDTPGSGWVIRCNSKKYLEDGLFEIAVAPYGEPAPYDPANDVVVGGGF
eukprot:CAMPEP_0183353400 /NCGR_PEP_ID=MMETSP0164_2-20130417/33233_1 /TAXON_ID=221442 /ORGANISM="Coccolithus pelagicus ssp braarudi, Strain PLY182g" /LENGTH=290 /DNA_ID=CAMNT_0025526067 /DNA_START=89 /DNA_END=961 /DNA_ORIENTATION=-